MRWRIYRFGLRADEGIAGRGYEHLKPAMTGTCPGLRLNSLKTSRRNEGRRWEEDGVRALAEQVAAQAGLCLGKIPW